MGCIQRRFVKEIDAGEERIRSTQESFSQHTDPLSDASMQTRLSYSDKFLSEHVISQPIPEGKEIYVLLEERSCRLSHAFTGCDTVSFFGGRGGGGEEDSLGSVGGIS